MAYDPYYDRVIKISLAEYLLTQKLFKQEGQGCGRQALNNLFGKEIFVKEEKTDKISLTTVCKQVALKLGENEEKYCPSTENYDISVLLTALDIYGYEVDNSQIPKGVPIGILLNTYYKGPSIETVRLETGEVYKFEGPVVKNHHWVVIRKYAEKTVLIDSTLLPVISEFTTDIQPGGKTQLINLTNSYDCRTMEKVFLPQSALKYDKFDMTDGNQYTIVKKKFDGTIQINGTNLYVYDICGYTEAIQLIHFGIVESKGITLNITVDSGGVKKIVGPLVDFKYILLKKDEESYLLSKTEKTSLEKVNDSKVAQTLLKILKEVIPEKQSKFKPLSKKIKSKPLSKKIKSKPLSKK